jgi:undecaprenyl-diphosphatase
MLQLQAIDESLFILINSVWTNAFLNWFFPIITDLHKTLGFQILAPLLVLFLFLKQYQKKGILYFFVFLCSLGATDFICSQVLKENIQRFRPHMTSVQIETRAEVYSDYGMPSNHAANMAAVATWCFFLFNRYSSGMFFIALLIGYSRVYVGAHFVSDVVVGFLFSGLFNSFIIKCFKYDFRKK